MINAIITDIEGTTSSLAFVKDVLFPYARNHIAAYIRSHENDPAVDRVLDEAREISGDHLDTNQLIQTFIQWIDEDKKITPLKTIQGLLWEEGYRQGDFKGHIYDDAVVNLRKWKNHGIRIYVYSSGSVYAQKLLFGHTEFGDLNPIFSGYFDTHTGVKTSAESYQKIAVSIDEDPENCLFLSDIKQELDAALQSGMHTVWLTRDKKPDPETDHRQVASFDEIDPAILQHGNNINMKSNILQP